MERRDFVKQLAIAAPTTIMTPYWLNTEIKQDNINNNGILKGFIVSDSHFGWLNEMQPSIEEQKNALKNIMNRFPDLDVFIDTGDANHNTHHRNENPYKARKDWVDIIQGGCGQLPFYYVIGNHELRSNEDADPEMRSNIMGSNSCRPYYSFDIQGIHFISFPELIRAIYITEEEWNWLELDLSLNRDKTIIMLSHNNIIGTTSGNEPGYRGIMDSERMMGIFKENPNIISWMHGHNHNYEIVNMQNMLFVSNGRIGGFDPSRGKHGIGGIYFEVSKEGLLVKCYSAEKDCFIDKFDSSLSQYLKSKTTFNIEGSYAYSYGVGGAVNGERISIYNHHIGTDSKSELFLTGCDHPIINDDPGMTKYTERKAYHGLDKILLAAKINHGNDGFDYLNPGIRLKANDNWWTTVTMPSDNYDKYTYFRCPVGKTYKVSIDLDVKDKRKQKFWLRLHFYDINGRKLRIVQSEEINVKQGRQVYECTLEIPEIDNFETIYNNFESNNLVNVAIEASFTSMTTDIDIYAIRLEQENNSNETIDAGVVIDEKTYRISGVLKKGEIAQILIDKSARSRSLNEIVARGNKRLTYLVRHSNLKWQVRNATVKFLGDFYEIDGIRNDISDNKEIIFAPLQKITDPYLQRIQKVEYIKFLPFSAKNRDIVINVDKVGVGAELEIFSKLEPKRVAGVRSWNYSKNVLKAKLFESGRIKINF